MTSSEGTFRALGARLGTTIGSSAVVTGLGVVGGIVLARLLGPTARGQLAMMLLWPQAVSSVGSLGIDLAATYFSADPGRRRDVPATALRLALVRSTMPSPLLGPKMAFFTVPGAAP